LTSFSWLSGLCPPVHRAGYSLPSGHSMMSMLVVLFILHKSRRISILVASLVLELFIVFEIIYLGTHTTNDMIVGFSFGITWFSIYLLLEDHFKHHRGVLGLVTLPSLFVTTRLLLPPT